MPNNRTDAVRFDELRRLLRLALDLRDLPAGSDEQRRHALTELAPIVGAQVGVWFGLAQVVDTPDGITSSLDVGWSGEAERRAFHSYVDHISDTPAPDPSLAASAMSVARGRSTFARHEVTADRDWYRSDHVNWYRREARVDSFIVSVRLGASGAGSVLGIHRAWGEPRFGERERRLVELFRDECSFLDAAPSRVPPHLLHGLTPRLRQTLELLAMGHSEKQVAADLGISPHTVHGYVKALHAHFGVQSRGELLALCLR